MHIMYDMVAGQIRHRAAGTQILGVDACVHAVRVRPMLVHLIPKAVWNQLSQDATSEPRQLWEGLQFSLPHGKSIEFVGCF